MVKRSLWNSRWLVLVASIWLQACAGIGYVYGSFSPLIKKTLHLNQKQMNVLGVAKDIGDSVGLFAGAFSDSLPSWGLILIGSLQNLFGYGGIWLIVTSTTASASVYGFYLICFLILIGTNGETYFNTATLVSCVRNFPRNRGPIVGILKGFTGLCGAIFSLAYSAVLAPDQAAFLLMIAIIPAVMGISTMSVIRPVSGPVNHALDGEKQETENFRVIYGICLTIAAYLLVVLVAQDLFDLPRLTVGILAIILFFILLLPLLIPIRIAAESSLSSPSPSSPSSSSTAAIAEDLSKKSPLTQPLLKEEEATEVVQPPPQRAASPVDPFYFSELEDEKKRLTCPEPQLKAKLMRMQSELFRAVAEGAVKVKRRKGPRRGQDFTLSQAVCKADFWLLFFALCCGSGSGLTAIDNLGQMGEAQGYVSAHMFVSMMSIWNFLGRVGGGYVSELVARDHAFPRPVMMGAAQLVMAVGHLAYAAAWPGSMYVGSLMVGVGYGAHWGIVPATASELFGLKNFGVLYNFLTVANPLGSLVFSGMIAGSIYDREAEKQFGLGMGENSLHCKGAVCFRLTFLIMTGVCILGSFLSSILVFRTRRVYVALYGNKQISSV